VSDPIVVACGADAHYLQPLAVMLQSLLVNLAPYRTVEIYIIEDGIEEDDKGQVVSSWPRSDVSVHWLSAQGSSLSALPLWGRMSAATYYKLMVPELLPDSVHQAIWLDCDIVVAEDVERLWEQDLSDRHALAVQDVVVPYVSSRYGVAHYKELGIARNTKYFNAGVMLMNLDLWRKDNIAQLVIEYLKKFRDDVFFWDQEGLNAVLADKWGELDTRWNRSGSGRYVGSTRGTGEPVQEKGIIHFTGNLKPWMHQGRTPACALYFRYLDMTAWAGWRPKRTKKSVILGMYESSRLRQVLYPAEDWAMRLVRAFTFRQIEKQ
jgi:lipopolysaccharide biosynthesis glycosyltransferase